jgi:hypothetical protein
MNTEKPVSPAIAFALQKYQAMTELRTEATLHPLSRPTPKSLNSYEVSGGVVQKVGQ